jgi:tetratricopeptide (TPR) repeat protein
MPISRALNIRRAVLLLVSVALLGAGVYGLHSFRLRRNINALLERADRAESRGDLGVAEKALERYLGYQPRDATALARYGLILAKRAETDDDRSRALQVLDMALRADPGRRDVRRTMVDMAVPLGQYADARVHLTELLRGPDRVSGAARPGDAPGGELVYLLGRCAEGERDFHSAAKWYASAVARAPERVDWYVRLADVLRNRLADPAGADRVMDARQEKDGVIAANRRSFRAYLERGLYRKAYRIDGAELDVARALELAPGEADVLLSAASFALDRRDVGGARAHLNEGLARHPGDGRFYTELAGIEGRSGRAAEAVNYLRRGIGATADPGERVRLLWALANALVDSGDFGGAGQALERLRGENVRPEVVRYLDARLRVAQERWVDALKALEAVRTLLDGEPDLAYQTEMMIGRCYEQIGDPERRCDAFQRAVALKPGAVPGRAGLAAALAATGRLDRAIEEYGLVVAVDPAVGTAMARLLVLHNLGEPAARRDWQAFERILGDAERAGADPTEVLLLRAEALVAQGQPDRARETLVKARDEHPESVVLWAASVDLEGRWGTPEAALSLLQAAERRLGDRVELRIARANCRAKLGGRQSLDALEHLTRDLGTFSPAEQKRLLECLTDTLVRAGDAAGAGRILGELARLRPADLGLRFFQLSVAFQAGDEDAATRALGEIRSLEDGLRASRDGNGPFWQCARARYLLWAAGRAARGGSRSERLEEAGSLLRRAAAQRPFWPLIPVSQAEVADLLGRPDEAINAYLRAVGLGERDPAVVRRTVQLLFERRRYEQADEVIRVLRERGPGTDEPQLLRLAAEVSLRVHDPARALDLARKSIPADSKDYRDRLWFGQVLWAAGDGRAAEAEFRRATELAGDAPDVWVVTVQFLARSGRKREAEAASERAKGRLSGAQAPAALARCYAEVGRPDQALEQYRVALADRPDDIAALRGAATVALSAGRVGEAETYLSKVIALKDKSPEDSDWARRLLAVVLASGGDHRRWLKALELLGQTEERATGSPEAVEAVEELRALAQVLALRGTRASRRSAIRALARVADRGSRTPEDRFLLSQLYQAEGDWPSAQSHLLELLATDESNPLYLAHLTRGLLLKGDPDGAQPWLERLEALEPRAYRTVELKARALKARGNAGEAVALLKANTGEGADRDRSVAALLEELGQPAAAEELYRRGAARSRRPEDSLVLAGFLSRQNRLPEALDLCEKAWGSCPDELAAAATVAALFSAPVDGEQAARAARPLEAAVRRSPTASLLFQLANVRSLQGNYGEAEQLYRQSIARDPTSSGPLNNLAWLLARHDHRGPEALELVGRALSLGGAGPDLLDTRAVAYLAVGRGDPAVKDLEEALAEAPAPDRYCRLAQAYLTAGKKEKAAAALRNAKSAGLVENKLHPLELLAYHRLLRDLAQ